MKFNKKYLLIIPLVIIVIATVKFIKDKLSPMRISGTVEATQVILSSRLSSNIKNNVPAKLNNKCITAALFAVLLAPILDNKAVTQVPIFCPKIIG